jgi:hypothetical protein
MANMKATYLPTNQAWVLTLGDQIITLEGWPMFFTHAANLDYALKQRGLERHGSTIFVT